MNLVPERGELDLIGLVALDGLYERFRSRVEGLTDAEYLWEPVEDCWSLDPIGDGRFRAHPQFPEPNPAPLTTIAWRLCHIGDFLRAERNWTWFGREPEFGAALDHPTTAASGMAYVDESREAWARLVRSLPEEEMWAPMGDVAGPYAAASRLGFAIHIMDEFIHHAAEVALMRDLYRVRDRLVGP
jgi:hypothetical protein